MKNTHPTQTDIEMFELFELTPDMVCVAGKDGFFRKVNPSVIKKLGYTEDEIYAKPIASFIHPDDREYTRRERTKLLEGKTLINFQNRYISKTGEIIWFEWTSIYIPGKEVVFAIAKDITQRKVAEQEISEKYIRFKGLATHFKASLEASRKYLALELHEELAQLASVARMDIDWILVHEENLSEAAKERLTHAVSISDLLIRTIRRISFSISPHMLDDLGLVAALEWQCQEFSVLNGIPCTFSHSIDESKISNEVKLDLFRICQDSLTNAMYHAKASSVHVDITEQGDEVILSITDNGIGFDPKLSRQSSGLVSMRKRAASVNGNFTISSQPGKGTTVRVKIAHIGS